MNYAIILAGGVGQRMRNSGMPKQFLEVFGKPIIAYTLEKFENCNEIDNVVVVCNSAWKDHMLQIVKKYDLKKVFSVVDGGKDRQKSIENGISAIEKNGADGQDIIVIHDGVRPLIQIPVITENIRVAQKYGNAMTVRPVVESVVVTDQESVCFDNFKKRDNTYSLTAPQTFTLSVLKDTYSRAEEADAPLPLLDAALAYTYLGNRMHMVVENNHNIKITTPEDYYILKAILELEENKYIFGL